MSREVRQDQHLSLFNNLNDEPKTHFISLGRAGKGIVVNVTAVDAYDRVSEILTFKLLGLQVHVETLY